MMGTLCLLVVFGLLLSISGLVDGRCAVVLEEEDGAK